MNPVTIYRLWRETMNRLQRYDRLVQEGKSLQPALDFARYVYWSGLIELMLASDQPPALSVDGALLRWTCEELQRKVCDRYRTNDTSPQLAELELRSLHDKIDTIAGYLAHGVVLRGDGDLDQVSRRGDGNGAFLGNLREFSLCHEIRPGLIPPKHEADGPA